MNCLECRRLTLIDPRDDNPARATHIDGCPACAAFARKMLEQDELIREAARVEVPEGLAARVLLNRSLRSASRRPSPRVWVALAATVLLAVALTPALIDSMFYKPFEQEIVAHMSRHDVLTGFEHQHVSSPQRIEEVLISANTAMPGEIGNILYASTCVVDGETMAHLLVENGDDEFVVFVMPQRTVVERAFTLDDWSGQFVTAGNRSVAVINRNGAGLDRAADRFSEQFGRPLSI